MAVLVTIRPEAGERRLLDGRLRHRDVRWLVDELDEDGRWTAREPGRIEGLLSLWPRRELRDAGIAWDALSSVRWLKLVTAGANHAGWSDLPDHVSVMTTPDATSESIAEYVLGAVIWWARGFAPSTRSIAAGTFQAGQPARAVSQLRIGTVGHGGVGQAVAREMAARDAAVRAVNRTGARAAAPVERVDQVSALPELAAWADVLVVCVPLHRDTVGLVDAHVLERLGDGLLVNVARGPVVDEQALHDWLQAAPGRRAAVLDVWWRYLDAGHPYHLPFHDLPNVIMTPHNSANVADFRHKMIDRACQDLQEQARTGTLRHVEDPRDYARVPGTDRQ